MAAICDAIVQGWRPLRSNLLIQGIPLKEVVSQDARLWQDITSAADFEVYPAVLVPSLEVVFFDEFFGDVRDFDADIFKGLPLVCPGRSFLG